MAKIETLVKDILGLFRDGTRVALESTKEFADKLSLKISSRFQEERSGAVSLRLSNIGSKCDRQLWYRINRPEKAEPLPPEARLKFLYGDVLEEMLLWLARQAGHDVRGEQDELNLYGVTGHRDGVIDGVLVDVKSASSYSFNEFAAGLRPDHDAFGYLTQLDTYLAASPDVDKSRAAFLVVDKTLGKLVLDIHEPLGVDYAKAVAQKQAIVAQKEPPHRAFEAEPDGASGNMKLGVACSYCPFKHTCWPGARTFFYASGPRYLVKVGKLPNVPEG